MTIVVIISYHGHILIAIRYRPINYYCVHYNTFSNYSERRLLAHQGGPPIGAWGHCNSTYLYNICVCVCVVFLCIYCFYFCVFFLHFNRISVRKSVIYHDRDEAPRPFTLFRRNIIYTGEYASYVCFDSPASGRIP